MTRLEDSWLISIVDISQMHGIRLAHIASIGLTIVTIDIYIGIIQEKMQHQFLFKFVLTYVYYGLDHAKMCCGGVRQTLIVHYVSIV